MSAVVLQPQPDLEAVKTQIRAFQQAIIDADPNTFLGASTAGYGPDSYVTVRGQGRYLLNASTNRLISAQLAQAMLAKFGSENPNPARLPDTPDDFVLARKLVTGTPLNNPIRHYLAAFADVLKLNGYDQTLKLSGVIDRYLPNLWAQRDFAGRLSPRVNYSSLAARTYSVDVLAEALSFAESLGSPVQFEVDNQGWQVDASGVPSIYDQASTSGFGGAPQPLITNINAELGPEQVPYLTYLNGLLTSWQDAVAAGVKLFRATAKSGIAIDSVKVLEPASANVLALNQAVSHWASPRYDFIRVEDNSWVAAAQTSKVPESFDLALVQLGYGIGQVNYTLGPVGSSSNLRRTWRNVDDAWGHALEAEVPTIYLWDYSAVVRDNVIVTTAKICGC